MTFTDIAPAAFSQRTLFEPIAHVLERFKSPGPPALDPLNALIETLAPAVVSGSGRSIRFIRPTADDLAYEARIFATGEVPTRADDWHDFFNALAWCVWPRAKTACNALHLAQLELRRVAGLSGRGLSRDALTQFDECGMVVVSMHDEIPALLAAHAWHDVFWRHRLSLQGTTRFLVFGHGSWDQLRAPFYGLCAKTIYRLVERDWLAMPLALQQADTDRWLANHLTERAAALTPRDLPPLPLLGIPGVTPESESEDYYRDTRQFRPRRSGSERA